MWKDFVKPAIRILLCLTSVPLSFIVTWKVGYLNDLIYRKGITQIGDFSHGFEDSIEPLAGLLPRWLVPQIIILITATGYAIERKSVWGYYSVLSFNMLISLLINWFFTYPDYEPSDFSAAANWAINRNLILSWAVIPVIYLAVALFLPRISEEPKEETTI